MVYLGNSGPSVQAKIPPNNATPVAVPRSKPAIPWLSSTERPIRKIVPNKIWQKRRRDKIGMLLSKRCDIPQLYYRASFLATGPFGI